MFDRSAVGVDFDEHVLTAFLRGVQEGQDFGFNVLDVHWILEVLEPLDPDAVEAGGFEAVQLGGQSCRREIRSLKKKKTPNS